jgi:predicted subunit of tRNA(5-methylaminomethyl-2-thiouridylate) methyltransferase
MIDVNKDGKADIAAFDDVGVWSALGKGDGTFNLANLTIPDLGGANSGDASKHLRMFADLRGDGVPSVVVFGDAGVWTAVPKGDGTYFPSQLVLANFGVNQGWDPAKHVRLMADVNHDGKADIVAFGDAGVWVALSTGGGTFYPPKLVLANFGVDQGWDPAKHVRAMADLNHDGKVDIVGFGDAGVWTALGRGDGTFEAPQLVLANFGVNQGWDPAKHVRLMADLNNDGKADIVAFGTAGVWTALSKGDGTFYAPRFVLANFGVNQEWDPSKHVRVMADLNHDGRADIVAFGDAGVWTALAEGDGTFAPPQLAIAGAVAHIGITPPEPGDGAFSQPRLVLANFGVDQEWSPARHIRVVADLNDDGRADIVGFGDAGVWTALGRGDGTFDAPQFVLEDFACAGRFDFNLEWSGLDIGGFPFNPRWRWQRNHAGTPNAEICHYFSSTIFVDDGQGNKFPVLVPSFSDCTDQLDSSHVDTPNGFNAFICSYGNSDGFAGHLNWFTSTSWEGWAGATITLTTTTICRCGPTAPRHS